jgi:hypothetical protein
VEIKMDSKKQIRGTMDIFNSPPFLVRLEMNFVNDSNSSNFREKIKFWLKEKNLVIQFEGELSDLTNSITISFKEKGLLLLFLNNIFSEFSFFDEREKINMANDYLISEAKKLFIAVDT